MARMPQIPAPDLSSRPDSRVGQAELPDSEAVAKPFADAGAAVGGAAGQLEDIQAQRDTAMEKVQNMADAVAVTRKKGEFALYAGDKLSSYIQQATDTSIPPEQRVSFKDIPDLLRKDLQERTDSDIKASSSQNIALGVAQAYAGETNKQLLSAQGIAQRGIVQQAKNNLVAISQGAVEAAAKASTPAGLAVAIAQMKQDVGTNAKNLHSEPDALLKKTGHDMVMGYIANAMLKNPVDAARMLDEKKGPHRDYLSGVEIAEERKKADRAFLAYGENQRIQLLKEQSDSSARDYEMKESGDLTPALAQSMNSADASRQRAVQANPNLGPDEKKKQTAMLSRAIETRTWLSELPITPGRIDPAMKTDVAVKIREDFKALGKNWSKSPQDLDKVAELRHDLAEAEKNRAVPASFAATVHTAITQMTGKALSKDKGDTGHNLWLVGFTGTSRQFGNRYLDTQIESKAFGKLSEDKQIEAFYRFHNKYNTANAQLQGGGAVSNEAARQMAYEALDEAAKGK